MKKPTPMDKALKSVQDALGNVLKAAQAAAQFEDDTKGQYWCGVCNRATVDCDAEPRKHQYDPQGPCAGMKLRKALREYGIDIPKLSNEELYERGMLTYLPRGWRSKSEV
jgi:hypothetical protein